MTLMRSRGEAVSTAQAAAGRAGRSRLGGLEGVHDPSSPADGRAQRIAGRRWSASLSAHRHARANGEHQDRGRHRHHRHDHQEVAAEHPGLPQQGAEEREHADPDHRGQGRGGHGEPAGRADQRGLIAPAMAPATR